MINAEVTARAGASDVTGTAKGHAGKSGADGENNGFFDALSSAGGGQRTRGRDEAPAEMPAEGQDAAEPGDEAANTVVAPVKQKPRSVLDLAAGVLLGKTGDRSATSVKEILAGKTDGMQKPETGKTVIGQAKDKASAASGKTERPDPTETDEVPAEDEDSKAEAQPAATAEVGVSEVLSLLAGAPPEAAAAAAAAGSRSSGPVRERTRNEDGGDDAVGSVGEGRTTRASAAADASDALDMPAETDAPLVDERIYRLSSARGSGQSMDMAIGVDDRGKVGFDARAAGGGNAESVMVLDSRRFLGFGQSANGAALTAAMSDDRSWAAAMTAGAALGDPLASSTGNVVNTLKLQLNPHDLGSVTATLRLSGETLNVHLTVENHAAYRQLSDDSSGMVEALRSQGFAVDQVTISVASTTQSDSGNQQQAGQQSSQAGQQQAAGHDGRQSNGNGREQDRTGAQPAQNDRMRGANETVSDPVTSGNARPDQLYL